MKITNFISLPCFFIAVCHTASADIIAYDSVNTTGNQGWGGALGMDFSVNAGMTIRVTELGAFDSDQDGFNSPIQIGIFDRNTSLLVGVSATLSGTSQPLVGNSRFFDIADFILGAGDYSIVAVGFNALDLNSNIDFGGVGPTKNDGGALTFTGTARYDFSPTLLLPSSIDIGPSNRYDAGTFEFVAIPVPEIGPVPEPSTFAFGAFTILAAAFRRRRSAAPVSKNG